MTTERADYLDTQTLGGAEGYFHTENAPTHATDGAAEGASPETPLVAASRSEAVSENRTSWTNADAVANLGSDKFDEMTNAELKDELKRRGEPIPHSPSKANLVAALRGE